jgi:hypothetical protein
MLFSTISTEDAALLVVIFSSLGGVIYWLTHKITKLEDRIDTIEKNPLLEAFRKTQVERAESLIKMAENIKEFETRKVSKEQESEEEKEKK